MMLATLLVLTLICARIAQLMAAGSGRSTRLWIWLAALLGPIALIALAILPRKAIPA